MPTPRCMPRKRADSSLEHRKFVSEYCFGEKLGYPESLLPDRKPHPCGRPTTIHSKMTTFLKKAVMVEAYIFVSIRTGWAKKIVRELAELPEVATVHACWGRPDIIAYVKAWYCPWFSAWKPTPPRTPR